MEFQSRPYASWLLSSLYLKLDLLAESESDTTECAAAIQQAETTYWTFLLPCSLCQKPTIFKDDAFDLPFCWGCLQREYHFWYRAAVYSHGSERGRGAAADRRA